jgi:hypothetical protein
MHALSVKHRYIWSCETLFDIIDCIVYIVKF